MRRQPTTHRGKIARLREAAAFIRAARRALPYTGGWTWNALAECLNNIRTDVRHHKKKVRETERFARHLDSLLYEPPVGQPD